MQGTSTEYVTCSDNVNTHLAKRQGVEALEQRVVVVVRSMDGLGQTILAVGEFTFAALVLASMRIELAGGVQHVRATWGRAKRRTLSAEEEDMVRTWTIKRIGHSQTHLPGRMQ